MNLRINKEYVKMYMRESSSELKDDKMNILNLDNLRVAALHILRAYYFQSLEINLKKIDIS